MAGFGVGASALSVEVRAFGRVLTRTYVATWAFTALVALVIAVTPGASALGREMLGLTFHPPPHTVNTWLSIALNNARVTMWPIACVALGGHRRPRLRTLVTVVLVATLVVNVGQVGLALGSYGPRLVPRLVHLPFEWLALAAGAGAWIAALSFDELGQRLAFPAAATSLSAVMLAAAVEVTLSG